MNKLTNKQKILGFLSSIIIILLAISLFIFIKNTNLKFSNNSLNNKITELENQKIEIEKQLADSQYENKQLIEALEIEQEKVQRVEREFEKVASTVGDLEKLSKTDPELLQKYSKVFFLNEHYIPPKLKEIEEEYVYDKSKTYEIHSEVWPFLEDMLDEATEEGVDLRVISSYRSFGTQAILKNGYVVTYGSGTANQFSADQGYSEHQLGTTLDFTTPELGSAFINFESTEAYDWLRKNAHRFGFVLSYPPNNSYYQFEPWHWRFVGRELAKDLYHEDKYFYDWDQRDIDKYLVKLFD